MNVLIASSSEHVKYFTVMLESLYENNTQEQIDVYVIFERTSDMDWEPLERQAKRFNNRILRIPVNESKFAAFPKASVKWPRILYFKLLVAEILPPHVDRVLLLESDMIITKSLRYMYEMDFEDKHLIASTDFFEYWGKSLANGKYAERRKKQLGISQELELFGGGAMLLNVDKFRSDNIRFDTLDRVAEKFQYTWGAPEETLFVVLFADSRKKVDTWSYYLSPVYWKVKNGPIDDPNNTYGSIIHYFICNKPWDSYVLDDECELDRIWWSYAKKTEFYDEMRTRFERRLRERIDYKDIKRTLENVDLYYQTLIRWKYVTDTRGQRALESYLEEKGISNIAVYGVNPLQMLLCNEIKSSEKISVSYLVDSFENGRKGEYRIQRVIDCSFKDVDGIVVASFLHMDAIKQNLTHVHCPVLSLQDIVEELLPDSFNQFVL